MSSKVRVSPHRTPDVTPIGRGNKRKNPSRLSPVYEEKESLSRDPHGFPNVTPINRRHPKDFLFQPSPYEGKEPPSGGTHRTPNVTPIGSGNKGKHSRLSPVYEEKKSPSGRSPEKFRSAIIFDEQLLSSFLRSAVKSKEERKPTPKSKSTRKTRSSRPGPSFFSTINIDPEEETFLSKTLKSKVEKAELQIAEKPRKKEKRSFSWLYVFIFTVLLAAILTAAYFIGLFSPKPSRLINCFSGIKASNNSQMLPVFFQSSDSQTITFGPPGFPTSSEKNISNYCFSVSGQQTFDILITFSVSDLSKSSATLLEYCFVDYLTVLVNNSPAFSAPVKDVVAVSSGQLVGSPFVVMDKNTTVFSLQNNRENITVQYKSVVLPGLVLGPNAIKVKYSLFGAGAVYFKMRIVL
jgi:hypothetical protein